MTLKTINSPANAATPVLMTLNDVIIGDLPAGWAVRRLGRRGMVAMAGPVQNHSMNPGENGGEAGIRTLGTGFGPYNGLANRRLQPLGHLTALRKYM